MMKRVTIILSICMMLAALTATARDVENLNREWRYQIGDHPGAEQPEYDDKDWQTVGLPHSFSIPYFMSKDFYVGYGWYRKQLRVKSEELRAKRFFIEFDGVFQEAEVYVNGQLAGSHRGGYTGFSVDITNQVKAGKNVIAVRVNNLWQATLAPRGGEHVFSGGIYRSVRLVRKSANAHIRYQGIRITTPTLEENEGRSSTVQVDVDVEKTSAKKLRTEVEILDADGKTVAKGNCPLSIVHCQLWRPSSPYLYTAVVRLYDGKTLLDEERQTFGFRWIRWSKDEGFFLNGEHLYLRGANVHQDQAGWGDAVTEEAARRDVRMVKEAGFNMIRGSHYPHSQAFIDECDRQGILFWSEAPFWGTAGPKDDGWWTASAYPVNPADTAAFEQSCLQQLEEMITENRNHPSVFVWSMCNEPFFTDGRTMPGVHRLLKRMVERTHQLDPTRKAAIGGAQRPLGEQRIDLIGDVAGYNGDGANIPDFQHPDVPSMVSEYGSMSADRPGRYTANWGDLNRDEGWMGRSWRGGQAIWCAFDHGSIFGDELGKMGIVDYFRLPKRAWYWYRNEYVHVAPPAEKTAGTPASIRLTASKYADIKTDGTDDVQLVAAILDAEGHELSNSPTITFRIVDGPGEFPTGRSITFASDSDIRIQDGQCAIALRSYYAGKTLVVASSEGLKADTIALTFIGAQQYQAGITQQIENRPYTRYARNDDQLQTYGTNNPTFASSNANGHSAGLAADGNAQTYWQPAATDNKPTWTLDTERGLLLSEVSIRFAKTVAHVTVEASMDQESWKWIGDIDMQRQAVISSLSPINARYVRIRFKEGSIPKLAEVLVKGKVN